MSLLRTVLLCAAVLSTSQGLGSAAWGQTPLPPLPQPSGTYPRVQIKLAPAPNDPSFQVFYDELKALVKARNRQAIEALVGPTFFWHRDLGESFDRRKSPVANFRSAMQAAQGGFWDGLVNVTRAPTAAPHSRRRGVLCSPGELPDAEEQKIINAADAMGSDSPYDILYAGPVAATVRVQPREDAAIVGKLQNEAVSVNVNAESPEQIKGGYRFVRLYDGRQGYVRGHELYSWIDARLCFSKTDVGWRIVGFVGGGD